MSTLDILKNAILMERRGKAFYEQVSSDTKIDAVRNIFSFMAKEEQTHIEQLSEQYIYYRQHNTFLLKEFPAENKGFVERILTTDMKKQINAAGFEAAAISAAIDFETKAIEVYTQSAAEAVDSAERSIFTWLAEWEMGHHKILNQLNEELKEEIWYDNSFWPF